MRVVGTLLSEFLCYVLEKVALSLIRARVERVCL